MTELNKGQKADQCPKKYLWFGYGNYGGQPNIQTPAGNIRAPGLFEELSEESKTERSPLTLFMRISIAVIGFTVLVMLLVWVISLILR
jgi:hypothetical protein